MQPLHITLLLAGGLAISGCAGNAGSVPHGPAYPTGLRFVPGNVYRTATMPRLRRVVLLPPYDVTANVDRQQDLDAAFQAALGAAGRFEVVFVSRNELVALCGRSEVNSTEQLPPLLVPSLQREYGADAVMFVDVTQDEPYAPLLLGARAKLVDARSGTLAILWTCDTVFNAGNPAVAASARTYQLDFGRQGFPADQDGTSVLRSPARFARYAAAAIFETLPR